MTYRERREARAARLREWAEKREREASQQLQSQPELRHDWAFITQPGRIPERERMNRRDDRAMESLAKAQSMASRAAEIERQADNAIYSDDPDAIDRLRERIASLEAEREVMKERNTAYRREHRAELAAMTPYERSQAVPHAPYELENLSGNLSRQRARLQALENPRPTWFHASRRDPDVCYKCDYYKSDHTPHERAPSVLMCPTR
jgi:hypothetical protein